MKRELIVLLFLTNAFLLVGCASSGGANPSYQGAAYGALVSQGDAEMDCGEWAKAVAFYTRAANLNPGDWDLKLRLADAYERQGQLKQADSLYESIIVSANASDVSNKTLVVAKSRQAKLGLNKTSVNKKSPVVENTEILDAPEALRRPSSASVEQGSSKKSWWENLKFWESDKPVDNKPNNERQRIQNARKASPTSSVAENTSSPVKSQASAMPSPSSVKENVRLAAKEMKDGDNYADGIVDPRNEPTVTGLREQKPVEGLVTKNSADKVDTKAVLAAVESWRSAWSSQDLDAYFAAYDKTFKGDQTSRNAWLAQRKQKILNARSVLIELKDVKVKASADNSVNVEFVQNYQAAKYHDSGKKVLRLVNTDKGWLIVEELFLK